jgi:DNA-binding NarL/FixJ family response regulator
MLAHGIIIVHSEPDIHYELKRQLRQYINPARVFHCYTYKDLFSNLRISEPALVILYDSLRDSWGTRTFQRLMTIHPELKTLIGLSSDKQKEAEAYLQSGAIACIDNSASLLEKAIQLLQGASYRDEARQGKASV